MISREPTNQPKPVPTNRTNQVSCRDVGLPAFAHVWHDATGRHPDWLLARLAVRKRGAGAWTHFPCGRWLSTTQDDGRIARLLQAADPGRCPASAVGFRLVAFTSDLRGAGTDANVFCRLHGSEGEGGCHRLGGGTRDFDRWA